MLLFRKMISLMLVIAIVLSLGAGFAIAQDDDDTPAPISIDDEASDVDPEEAAEEVSGTTSDIPITVDSDTDDIAESVSDTTDDTADNATPISIEDSSEDNDAAEDEDIVEDEELSDADSEEASHKAWSWTEPGNSTSSILSGGVSLITDDVYYYSNDGIYLSVDGSSTLLADVAAKNLNLCGEWLYYTSSSTVYRIPATGGTIETVYKHSKTISQLYVMGDELRFTSNGCVYSYDMETCLLETLDAPDGLLGLIPTEYGNLYLTGSVRDYTLYAEGIDCALLSDILSCYTDGDYLVVVNMDGTWQASLAALFNGSVSLVTYSLHQDEIEEELSELSDLTLDEQLANEAAYLESDEYWEREAILAEAAESTDTTSDSGISLASTTTVVTTGTLTTNQQNMVTRARQFSEALWTCLVDIYCWGGNNASYVSINYEGAAKVVSVSGTVTYGYFAAGETYKGLPYTQAVNNSGYVGWNITLAQFMTAVNNSSSVFYTKYSTYTRTAPYYGTDCSAYVSYSWGLSSRQSCSSLVGYSTKIGTDYTTLQVGDAINNPSSHILIVTELGYDADGNIVSIEVSEETPCKIRVTCYGEPIEGRTYDRILDINYLVENYLTQGYSIYRIKSSYTTSAVSSANTYNYTLAPTVTVTSTASGVATVSLSHVSSSAVIYYTTDGSVPTTSSSKYTGSFTITKETTVRAIAVVDGDTSKSLLPLNVTISQVSNPTLATVGDESNGVYQSGNYYYITPGDTVTLECADGEVIYYTTDGTTPTTSSAKVTETTAITVTDGMVITAFATASGSIMGNVATYNIKLGYVYTITLDDTYGFISSASGTIRALEGSSVKLTFSSTSSDGYTLGNVYVNGTSVDVSSGSYTISNISENTTVTTEIYLPFSDVSLTSWYTEAVAFVYAKSLMLGVSSTTFSPTTNMTRAQFITLLGRFAGVSDTYENFTGLLCITNVSALNMRSSTSTSSSVVTTISGKGTLLTILSTVSASESKDGGVWYQVSYGGKTGYVRSNTSSSGSALVILCPITDLTGSSVSYASGYTQWAYFNGIVNGTSSTTFSPGKNISRQDICVVLYNYLTEQLGKTLSTATATFNDSSSISSYATNAVNALANIGIIKGDSNGNFNPTSAATRAEVATMFMRLYSYLNG